MPDLTTSDGETVASSLTAAELEQLSDYGVDFDFDADSDADRDADGDRESSEAVPDADGSETVDDVGTDAETGTGAGERDETPSGGGSDEPSDTDAAESGGGDGGVAEIVDADVDMDDDGDGRPDGVRGRVETIEHTIDPDDELADELRDRDDDELWDIFDVDAEEVIRADERDAERWHQLVKSLSEYDTDIAERTRERDERIGEVRVGEDGDALQARAESSGAITELKEGFRELVSRPTPRPAVAGPQIDPYNVARRASGDRTIRAVFEESVTAETGDRCIGLATDISGSMRGDITELKIAGGVIAEATEIVGDDFVWEAFSDQYGKYHEPAEERLDLRIVTAPDEEFAWEHTESFTASKNEPTAAGMRDCRRLMEETDAREYVMIVITDGVTLINEDGSWGGHSGEPVEHTRQVVEECRADGIEVIGLGIGGMDEEKMDEQFGTDAQGNPNYMLTDIDSLAEDVLGIYKQQMSVTR